MRITRLFKEFFSSESASGYVLIFTTIISLLLANVFIGQPFIDFFHQKAGFSNSYLSLNLSVEHWINDGLMAIFFLLVGLEIERELYIGELSSIRNASLPLFAALGGMLIPFLIHFAFNNGLPTAKGGGIPMATDIAFAIGVLSLGKNVPYALKVFLTAFAIIDDLGAILIIGFFYTSQLQIIYLGAAAAILGALFLCNRLKVYRIWVYVLLGVAMWYCMLQSGVHATLAGVLLAFAMPFGSGNEQSLSYRVQHWLHKPVAFFILPLFALANTGIIINDSWISDLQSNNSLGIMLGLVAGKPIGIMLFCGLAIALGWSSLPESVSWKHLGAAGLLGGIGFTMSIFITLLAFDDAAHQAQSKIAILAASVLAALLGLAALWWAGHAVKTRHNQQKNTGINR
jgi:Na+:H+ antiporter, NhaA family